VVPVISNYMAFLTEITINTGNYEFNSVEELVQLVDEANNISLFSQVELARGRGILLDIDYSLLSSRQVFVTITWASQLDFLKFISNSKFLEIKTWIDTLGWTTQLDRKQET